MAHIKITVERHWSCLGSMTRSNLFMANEPLTTRKGVKQLTAGELIRRALEIECGKLTPSKLREQIRRLEVTAKAEFSTKEELRGIVGRLTSRDSFTLQAAGFLRMNRKNDHPKNDLDVAIGIITPTDLTRIKTWHVYTGGKSGNLDNSPEEIIESIRFEAKQISKGWDRLIDPTESLILAIRLSLSPHAGSL